MGRRLEWTSAELRAHVAAIPRGLADYGRWWTSPPGRRLHAWLAGTAAVAVARAASARCGRAIDPDEVVGLAVEALAPPSQLARALRAPTTTDPAAYLARSLTNALAREHGAELGLEACRAELVAPAPAFAPATGLPAAIDRVCRTLDPLTPPRLRPSLTSAVEQIVERAAEGALSRLHARAASDERLVALGWTQVQLRALVNVVVGARPDHARSSLVAGYLVAADWSPRASRDHRSALERYARRMHRGEVVHGLLAG